MKILYLGIHGQKNNNDEGAILEGLEHLGHTVTAITKTCSITQSDFEALNELAQEHDFVLFHKINQKLVQDLSKDNKMVCWYFDPLYKGFKSNDNYIESIQDYLWRGFFTDGDFVAKSRNDNRDNIYSLKQGFDDQFSIDRVNNTKVNEVRDVLFIGTVGLPGYAKRTQYVEDLTQEIGPFAHTNYSVFKNDLTIACRETKVMLGMPPVTDRYWSNRVYLLAGRGACILHPFSYDLHREFGNSIEYYCNIRDLKAKIKMLSCDDASDLRGYMRRKAQKVVLRSHCYYHRCKELIDNVR